jgi:hypothetical protein
MVPGSSDFYVSVVETHRVFRVSAATGAITTIAGAGGPGYNGDNIPANTAQIAYPYGIAVDQATGDLSSRKSTKPTTASRRTPRCR